MAAASIALTAGTAVAQPNGDGVTTSGQQNVTAISTTGGPTLRTTDGGNTWQMVDPETAKDIQNDLGRKLQGMMTGNMMANTKVSVDPYGTSASVEYVAPQSGEVFLTIHDARGVEVMRIPGTADEAGPQKTIIDVTSLLAGSYYLRIVNNASVVGGGKLIVTR
jgi:photosystem II stability/assembly factor-like uncharacterized protein